MRHALDRVVGVRRAYFDAERPGGGNRSTVLYNGHLVVPGSPMSVMVTDSARMVKQRQ